MGRRIASIYLLHPGIPITAQVQPVWVLRLDKSNLFFSAPALELLFAVDCLEYVIKRFPIEQAIDAISLCEPVDVMEFVFEDAFVKIAGNANVERSG